LFIRVYCLGMLLCAIFLTTPAAADDRVGRAARISDRSRPVRGRRQTS
jgi:hypothetical protein